MTILFLHGWQSTPGGVKPTYLKTHGHEVLNPALPDDDFDAAVGIAQAEFDKHQPQVVVGSSRGGAVAMNIDSGKTPLVLLCPAWKRWGAAKTVKPNAVILHSPADETVAFADSQELLHASGLPESALITVGNDHRLADPKALEAMLGAVERAAGRPREAGVPRRFGMGTLLILTAMYAVLFAVLRAFEVPPFEFLIYVIFFTGVGLGQMLLFKGEQPRTASMLAGMFLGPCLILGIDAYENHMFRQWHFSPDLYVGIAFSVPLGIIYVYLIGVLIAGVFLLMDKLKSSQRRSADAAHAESSGT